MASGKTLQSTIEIAGILSPSLQNAIKGAVSKLDEMSAETLDQVGAAEKLSAEISAQESVLKSLKKGYADYVVSGRESSDEAATLSDTIEELSEELEINRETLAAAEKAAERLGETNDDNADAYTKLERKIKDQQDELDKLCREYSNVALEQGKNSKEAKDLEAKIKSLSGELDANETKLQDVGFAAKKTGDKVEDSGDGYTVLKDVISDFTKEALDKAIEGFKELALEGDSALSLLEARTGASADEMEGFEDIIYDVYNGNYGESISAVSDTLSTVLQMTDDLDDASLKKITKNALTLEKVFGFDTAESMRAVNSLMNQFGISADDAFNLVVQGAQKGLNQNDDLLDVINEYAVQFKSAGYTADEMFNMLANGVDAGTWSVDKLGDAVKEYNIRMQDGTASDALMKNRKALGLTKKEAKKLAKAYGEGGEAGAEAMKTTLDAIMAVEDENQRYQLGVAMFGTMWEDLGEDAVSALFNTEGAIDSANDAMDQADSAAYDNLESSLSQLGRTIKAEVLKPIADKLTPIAKDAVDFVESKVGPAVDYVIERMPVLGGVLLAVGAIIAGIKIAGFVKGLGSMLGLLKGGGLGSLFGGKGGGSSGGGGGIFGAFSKLANTKVSTVLKGMTNLSIILLGLGALATVAAWAAPYVTSLCEGDEFLKLMAALSIVGLVGTGMSKLAASVGKIPVARVAKGLASIAIVMVGLGALTAVIAWVAPYITELCDSEAFFDILAALSIVGLVGAALAGLAGLIGMIPIQAVLMGLANIALVLLGFTGIIAAFGALSAIDGFDDFITDGGATLQKVCTILGGAIGSVVGSFGESLSESLPTIGQNLSDFADNIAPMFETFSDVDTDGISDFATALAALIAVIAGQELVSLITGEIDYAGLGTDLSDMATGLSGFFDTIMDIPEGGFEKATALFDCLAGISSLPKEGGVVGWFQGEVDYSKMATGLTDLSSEGVIGFFTAVQGIPEEGFTAASNLFNCLAGISSLPKDGGVVGWFTGEVDFSKIATGVADLGSEDMISAITAISGIPEGGFSNLTAMFDTLAGIKALPKEGGIVGWFTGDATSTLTSIAGELPGVATSIADFFANLGGITDFTPISDLFDTLGGIKIDSDVADKGFFSGVSELSAMGTELATFATNGATFFTMINGLSLDNLTGFWDALAGADGLSEDLSTLDTTIGTALSNIVTTTETKMTEIRDAINLDTSEEKVSGSMNLISSSMGSAFSSAYDNASNKFSSIYNAIKNSMSAAVSAVTEAITKIKNKLNFSWSLPKLKLPHVNISGEFSIDPPSVPKFSVSWYKDGGILTQPTVFGASGSTLLAGGEAGAEAVLPLQVLWDKMEQLLRAVINSENTMDDPSDAGLTSKAGELLTLDDFSLGSLANSGGVVYYYDFSNFTWSPQIQTGNEDSDDFMTKLRAHEAEFFEWLDEFVRMREVAQYA